jgi:MerR family transcriptional regulator/heat shock protein HspR
MSGEDQDRDAVTAAEVYQQALEHAAAEHAPYDVNAGLSQLTQWIDARNETPAPGAFPDDTPVYVISIAAQLSGLHPQTLRTYDRLGLVSPKKATGRGRRYSMRDIVTLREIQRLSQEEGVNLAGIQKIIELQRAYGDLREENQRLVHLVEELNNELESTRAVAERLAQRSADERIQDPTSAQKTVVGRRTGE